MSTGWIISLVVIVVAVCAGLAALGFRGRVTIVGIDLGTTFSVVGIQKNGEVVIVSDHLERRIFPSVVSYQDNGEILVAYDALAKQAHFPHNTIYNAKRFIGKSLDDPSTLAYASEHPFAVVPCARNMSQVCFAVNATGHGPLVAPEEVGVQVLRHLLKVTAEFLGHNQVNKAVMAVPAKFSPLQRQATAAIYAAAGLKVVRVIEEPTAAAVAYRLHKKDNIHHILVYDFGGGTLDVSLLYVAQGSVQVYATDGDETLGGSDLDLCLFKQIKSKIETITHTPLAHPVLLESAETADDSEVCNTATVLTKAEEIKKQLTYQQEVLFHCAFPSSAAGPASRIQFPVRTADLEEGCKDLFERAMVPVHRLLEELEMSREDVDEVVLVGGSTRIPRVKQMLREYFEKELNDHIDPDITVAYGAASIID